MVISSCEVLSPLTVIHQRPRRRTRLARTSKNRGKLPAVIGRRRPLAASRQKAPVFCQRPRPDDRLASCRCFGARTSPIRLRALRD
jgi:hypothetical protein